MICLLLGHYPVQSGLRRWRWPSFGVRGKPCSCDLPFTFIFSIVESRKGVSLRVQDSNPRSSLAPVGDRLAHYLPERRPRLRVLLIFIRPSSASRRGHRRAKVLAEKCVCCMFLVALSLVLQKRKWGACPRYPPETHSECHKRAHDEHMHSLSLASLSLFPSL